VSRKFLPAVKKFITRDLFIGPNQKKKILEISAKRLRTEDIREFQRRWITASLSIGDYGKKPKRFLIGRKSPHRKENTKKV
jgi:hypothetical protein